MINKIEKKEKNVSKNGFLQKNQVLKSKSLLKILLTIFLFIGGLTSIFFAFFSSVESTTPKDQFGQSYNTQLDVQLSAPNTSGEGNSNTTGINGEISQEEAQERLKTSADAFKIYLTNKNVDFEGVHYELSQNESGEYIGTIFSNILNIDSLENSINEDIDLPRSSAEVLFSNFDTNFIEIVPFNTSNQSLDGNFFENNLNLPIINSYGLNLKDASIFSGDDENENTFDDEDYIASTLSTSINIENFATSAELKTNTEDETTIAEIDKRKMIVFNDVNALVQKMNYSNLLQYWSRGSNANHFADRALNEFEGIEIPSTVPEVFKDAPFPSEIIAEDNFDKYILAKNDEGNIDNLKTKSNFVEYINVISTSFWNRFPTLKSWTDATYDKILNFSDTPQIVTKQDVYLMANGVRFDGNEYIDISDSTENASQREVVTETIYNGVSQQLVSEMAVVGEITIDNYSQFFPETNTIEKDGNKLPGIVDGIELFALPSSLLDALNFGTFSSDLNSKLTLLKETIGLTQNNIGQLNLMNDDVNYSLEPVSTLGGNAKYNFGQTIFSQTILQNKLNNISVYESLFLILGIVLMLVGIIVSILYRVPGLFAFLSMGTAISYTVAILSVLNFNFSFGLFSGITLIIVLLLASILLILERSRKQFLERKPAFEAGVWSIRKSLISIIDLHAGSMLIALGLVFLGANELRDFGFAVIIGAFVSFVSLMVFFILNFYLFVSDVRNRSIRFYFFGKKISKRAISKEAMITKNNEYHSVLEKGLKLHFNWKITAGIIALLLTFALVILTLILTIKFPNSLDFNNGTIIYLSGIDISSKFGDYSSILGINWTTIIFSDDLISFGSSNPGDLDALVAQLQLVDQSIIIRPTISSDVATIDTFSSDIVSILAGIGFAGIYGLVRFNFYGGISIFTSTLLGTWIGISVTYAFFFFIGSNSVLSYAFAAIISYLMSMGYVSVTNSRFNRKEIFDRQKIGQFINANANNLKYYWISIIIIVIAIAIAQFAFSSPSFYWLIGTTLLATLVSVAASIVTVMTCYYGFILLRQLYVKNTVYNSITNRSSKFDAIDEELVKGINYYE